MGFLDEIKTPADVKKLKVEELGVLAEELRNRIIGVVRNNGGHLSSNLGAVDIILALHYVFDFPSDKLVFDVGHQAYAHKILSGRNEVFDGIRTSGGISGFPNIFESEYDAFSTGHAGNSLSASLGYCAARDLSGENYKVINLVGDASFFNGEYLEALSSKSDKPKNLIVILNDNGMSISKNENALYKFVSKMTTRRTYSKMMSFAEKTVGKTFIGRGLKRFKKSIKLSFNKKMAIFDALGLKYLGIFDGHDIKGLVRLLTDIKNNSDKAVLLHLKTVKGKGMPEAEKSADYYHGVGKNLVASGNTFSFAAGKAIEEIAEKDEKAVAICAGMKDGVGLGEFAEKYPSRFFDVGIAEEHAVTLAAGMAIGGLKPFVCIYSTFLQRSYDQIMQDVCAQNLPVVFLLDRAGAVGADGVTHQGLFDLSYLRSLPNMSVFAPKDGEELKETIKYCMELSSPCAIRYPNGIYENSEEVASFSSSVWTGETEGDNVILCVGPAALSIAEKVKEKSEKSVAIVNARRVAPLDGGVLDKIADKNVITIEENVKAGGFGESVALYYAERGVKARLSVFAFPLEFMPNAPRDEQIARAGITCAKIEEKLV